MASIIKADRIESVTEGGDISSDSTLVISGMPVNVTYLVANNQISVSTPTVILSGTIQIKTKNPLLVIWYHEPQSLRSGSTNEYLLLYIDGNYVTEVVQYHRFWNVGSSFRVPIDGMRVANYYKDPGSYPIELECAPYNGGTITHSYQSRTRTLVVMEVAK